MTLLRTSNISISNAVEPSSFTESNVYLTDDKKQYTTFVWFQHYFYKKFLLYNIKIKILFCSSFAVG
jgi:hypothetical protein